MLMIGAWYSELPKEVIKEVDELIEHGALDMYCMVADVFVGGILTDDVVMDEKWISVYKDHCDQLREVFKIEPIIKGY